MNEREAKIKDVMNVLECLNEAPFKKEYEGVYWNKRHMAEKIVDVVEQVEREFEFAY